jgi:hypothetical protein
VLKIRFRTRPQFTSAFRRGNTDRVMFITIRMAITFGGTPSNTNGPNRAPPGSG